MKKKFAIFLCVLLMLTMTLTACGDKKDFIAGLKAATEITRGEGEIIVDFSVKGDLGEDAGMLSSFMTVSDGEASGKIKINTTTNDAKNMKMDIALNDSKITDIIIVDGIAYINYRAYMTFISGAFGAAMIPSGKDYMRMDSAFMTTMPEDPETDAASASYMNAFWQAVNTFSTLLETAAKDVSPAVMYKDGDNYCFKLTDENVTAFANKLGDALSNDFEKLLDDYIKQLKASDCESIADDIEEGKTELNGQIASAAKDLKDFKYDSSDKFSCSASTSLKGKSGSRIWTLGLGFNFTVDNDTEINVDMNTTLKEYKDAKEITIDQSKIMTSEELQESMGAMFGSSGDDDYGFGEDDYGDDDFSDIDDWGDIA